jgi:hypothetical protein
MTKLIPAARKLVVGAVAVGALSLGTAGIAGAATTAPTPKVARHFNCANATRVLARIDKGEARITAGLPKLTAAKAKATQAGDTKLAARIQKRITRLESAKFHARLTRVSAAIEAKCNVSVPGTTSGSSSASATQA